MDDFVILSRITRDWEIFAFVGPSEKKHAVVGIQLLTTCKYERLTPTTDLRTLVLHFFDLSGIFDTLPGSGVAISMTDKNIFIGAVVGVGC